MVLLRSLLVYVTAFVYPIGYRGSIRYPQSANLIWKTRTRVSGNAGEEGNVRPC